MMARLLKVSISRFYDWLKQGLSQRKIQTYQQTILVKIAPQETKESYDHIRLTIYLQLTVQKRNLAAVHLYKKLGFIIEGQQERGACIEGGEFLDVYLMGRLIDE